MDPAEEEEIDRLEEGEIVRRVDALLADAIERGVSHMHIEPGIEWRMVPIRLRVDGNLETAQVRGPARALIARLKIVAGLDISERRRSQHGSMEYECNGRVVRVRVVTLPTVEDREDVVIRFDEPNDSPRSAVGV